MRILTFSTLYPSAARPGYALFVEKRLLELIRQGGVEAKVVAPVPWFPSTSARFGAWGRWAATPRHELRHGIEVHHPRYPLPPAIGQTIAPWVLAAGAAPTVRGLMSSGYAFDVIDAHYYYPDGVAATLLGRWLGKPVVITARGSDINVLGRYPLARRMMRSAALRASASIGVSQALADELLRWGAPPESVHVLRNGVDLERFQALDRAESRARLGLEGTPIVLVVGNLVEVKDPLLALETFALLRNHCPEARLVYVGDGPLRQALEARAEQLGLRAEVRIAGAVMQEALPTWYSAADATLLSSRSEGWPNVLLESMACGTPVIAAPVGGCPEIVGEGPAGMIAASRDARALHAALQHLLDAMPDRPLVRAWAEGHSWSATAHALHGLFQRVIGLAESRRQRLEHA